jgi:NDP-sugar pyrophosphorylase family protein
MKGMILAAGLGTRLRPWTEKTPKALLPVGGKPLLEILLSKMAASGIEQVAVNAHHHADQVDRFLRERERAGVEAELFIEEEILGTGGGVRNAASFLEGDAPVLVHNVDVLSNLLFRRMLGAHEESGAVVTLAVQRRPTDRPLAADSEGRFCGRWGEAPVSLPRGEVGPVAFSGIQIMRGDVPSRLPGKGAFSLIDSYLSMARRGEEVRFFPMDEWYWADVGTRERMEKAEEDFRELRIPLESLMS